ncbi:hypothetical protein ABHN04_26775 [Brevibacillus parabrevis]|nr:hypothetical protein [Brevibacillus sp.]
MKYTVWEEFFRWRWIVRKNVGKRTAEKLVAECPVGRHRWIEPI